MKLGWLLPFMIYAFLPTHSAIAARVSGVVGIKGTRDTLPNTSVFLLPLKQKTTSGVNGYYSFESVPRGAYTLVVIENGFLKYEQPFELDENQNLELNPLLVASSTLEFETTIESKDLKPISKKTISKKQAAATPGAGLDPVRAVQNLPGVNRPQGFSSQVIIQGSAPQDTRYTIEGHEIPLIFHFGGLSSVFNPELTESYDFFAAGYPSQYGRAMGGILNLNTKSLNPTKLKGSAFIDTFNSGASFETPLGPDSKLAVGARISYIGQVLKAAFKDKDEFSLSVAPSYSDLSVKYENKLSDRGVFAVTAIGSKDTLEFITSNPIGNDPSLRGSFRNETSFFRIIPSYTFKHNHHASTRFSLGLGRDFITSQVGDIYFNLKTVAATTRIHHQNQTSPTLTLAYGMDHRLALADVAFNLPVVNAEGGLLNPLSSAESKTADLKNVSSHSIGFYFNPIYKPTMDSKWTLTPGVRIDYFDAVSDLKIGPRFSARYALSPTLDLVSAAGLYFQPPREQEYSKEYGNPAIKSPSSWHFKFAAEKDLSETLSRGSEITSGVFARLFQNLVIPDTSQVYSNLGKGKSFGWENSFTYSFEPWNVYGAYTLSRSTRESPTQAEYLYQYDQTHFLTLIAGVNLPKQWRLSSRYRYVTGALDTIPTGAALDIDNDVFIPIRGNLFNTRVKAFSMLDFRVDKKWLYNHWTLSLYLDIQNVLNTQNVEGYQYSYDYTRKEEVKGIPILPIFGLKGEF